MFHLSKCTLGTTKEETDFIHQEALSHETWWAAQLSLDFYNVSLHT